MTVERVEAMERDLDREMKRGNGESVTQHVGVG
jgi:hypothetical protein